jgi:hypothetical protein
MRDGWHIRSGVGNLCASAHLASRNNRRQYQAKWRVALAAAEAANNIAANSNNAMHQRAAGERYHQQLPASSNMLHV